METEKQDGKQESKDLDVDKIFSFLDELLPGLGFEEMEKIAEDNKEWAVSKTEELVKEPKKEAILEALTEAFTRGANAAADALGGEKKEVLDNPDDSD